MIVFEKKTVGALCGFTLIEIIIVVAILSIAALLAIPMLSTAADTQLRSAANMIAADMEYARSLAISRQQNYSVVFSAANDTYEVQDKDGYVVVHPLNVSSQLLVDFANDSRFDRVDVVSANFDGAADETITFDYMGSPYSGSGTGTALTSGEIILQAEGFEIKVRIEPVTGYVTIHQ